MATDGLTFEQWLRDAKIARGKLTAEQLAVQPVPDTRFLPVPQPPPAGQPGPGAQFLRQELPQDP